MCPCPQLFPELVCIEITAIAEKRWRKKRKRKKQQQVESREITSDDLDFQFC